MIRTTEIMRKLSQKTSILYWCHQNIGFDIKIIRKLLLTLDISYEPMIIANNIFKSISYNHLLFIFWDYNSSINPTDLSLSTKDFDEKVKHNVYGKNIF